MFPGASSGCTGSYWPITLLFVNRKAAVPPLRPVSNLKTSLTLQIFREPGPPAAARKKLIDKSVFGSLFDDLVRDSPSSPRHRMSYGFIHVVRSQRLIPTDL
jgi:hypothetical protein